jgi:hypothetical protein
MPAPSGIVRRTAMLKLQRLQNRILRAIGNLSRGTQTLTLHGGFQTPYVYDYITKIYKKQAEVIQTHGNMNIRNTAKNEA